MPATLDTASLGMPVDIGQIGRELKKLWEQDGGVSTRASLINFAVYCEGAEAMRANTELIMQFTREHACRAILIGYEPHSEQTQVRAWINAHCHLSRAGAKQVCCEQISFLLEGDSKDRIANILFSNLDSDLPLVLWWQAEFSEAIDTQLWSWVDRLLYDSQSWRDPKQQFALLKQSIGQSRLTLCDLNWTRTLHLRQAVAQMFDYPENLALFDELESIEIAYAPEYRLTALLLAAWLAGQLKLERKSVSGDEFVFQSSRASQVRMRLRAQAGRSISRCMLAGGESAVQVQRDAAGDFFRVEVRLSEGVVYHHLLPAGSNDTTALLLEEISGGGRHRVYLKALAMAEQLL